MLLRRRRPALAAREPRRDGQNLTVIVNGERFANLPHRAGRKRVVQVRDYTVLPHETTRGRRGRVRPAHHLPLLVDVVRPALCAPERP